MRTKDYDDDDFLCRCGRCAWSRTGQVGVVRPELMQAVQAVHDVYGGGVHVVSGRRCHNHNLELRGKSHGYHTSGMAADLVSGDLERLADAAEVVPEVSYIELCDDHVHIDIGRHRSSGRRVDARRVKGGVA
ncbi:MAG: hypothetical protein IJA33_00975 [Oscillospiraceae bacterium]|nr:hypothetical protein [Oscillospiraceae bacterium]MBQ3814069.1 hypothetical protein [Bacteroidales bacterium]